MRIRIRLVTTLSLASAILAVATALSPQWIEAVFGVDPDNGNGFIEWGVVFVLAVFAVTAGVWVQHARGRLAVGDIDA